MAKGRSNWLRRLIALVALIAGFVSACAWLINRPETLKHALAVANVRSDWQIGLSSFHWSILESEIALGNLSIEQRSTGKSLYVAGTKIRYRLLGFLRGRLVIDELSIDDARMALPPQPGPKKPLHRLDVARLVLLKSIELTDGEINSFTLSFGKGMSLKSDLIKLALVPSIFGDSRLAIRTDGIDLTRNDKPIASAGLLSLKTSTRLERWKNEFPYMNSFTGSISIQDITAGETNIDKLLAHISMEEELLKLEELAISINGRELIGKVDVKTDEQKYDLDIEIPKPIPLPYLGSELETVNTAGKLSAKIKLSGEGFVPMESRAKGHVDITHSFDVDPESPVSISTDVSLGDGVIRLTGASIRAGKDSADAAGTIDIPSKMIELSAKGKMFPLEHVFNKFRNAQLAKIYGPTDFEGTFKGWGKKFEAHVTGTTYNSGWKPIAAERVLTELRATYDLLSLKGSVLSGNREAGKADLEIKFGPKIEDQIRSKFIDFQAQLSGMSVDGPLAAYGLTGTGSGTITIKGPHTAFTGHMRASIKDGSWHGIPFEQVGTDMDITRRRLTFTNMEISLPSIQSAKLEGSLAADIGEGGNVRFYGEPIKGLSIDTSYAAAASRWNVTKIAWNDPERPDSRISASGTVAQGGPLSMRVNGNIESAMLPPILPIIREAAGPISVDVGVSGSSSDPRLTGTIGFDDTKLAFRSPQIAFEALNGKIRLAGSSLYFEDITAEVGEGTMKLTGRIDERGFKPTSADLSLEGSQMRYRSADKTLTIEFDGTVRLTGAFPNPTLSGDVTILDGKYSKDFNIIDVIKSEGAAKPWTTEKISFNPKLDLHVRNSGDMAIRNNVGDIWLEVNVDVRGTREKPVMSGAIETTNGQIHYMGMLFDITKGFIELRGDIQVPYLEVYAQKEVDVYNISLALHGPVDNLQLDLSATSPTGPLDKRDVVSLLIFGATEQERTAAAQKAGSQFTTTMVAQSLSGIVERPISRFTHLDVFRLEAADTSTQNISRLNIGKQVSDRLTLKFITDIGKSDAVQTFAAEYQITDNLLIKGAHSTDSRSEFSGLLRFRLR